MVVKEFNQQLYYTYDGLVFKLFYFETLNKILLRHTVTLNLLILSKMKN